MIISCILRAISSRACQSASRSDGLPVASMPSTGELLRVHVCAAVHALRNGIASDGIIYYMNGQSIDALAFRVVSISRP